MAAITQDMKCVVICSRIRTLKELKAWVHWSEKYGVKLETVDEDEDACGNLSDTIEDLLAAGQLKPSMYSFLEPGVEKYLGHIKMYQDEGSWDPTQKQVLQLQKFLEGTEFEEMFKEILKVPIQFAKSSPLAPLDKIQSAPLFTFTLNIVDAAELFFEMDEYDIAVERIEDEYLEAAIKNRWLRLWMVRFFADAFEEYLTGILVPIRHLNEEPPLLEGDWNYLKEIAGETILSETIDKVHKEINEILQKRLEKKRENWKIKPPKGFK
jgi:hypothetical protein